MLSAISDSIEEHWLFSIFMLGAFMTMPLPTEATSKSNRRALQVILREHACTFTCPPTGDLTVRPGLT